MSNESEIQTDDAQTGEQASDRHLIRGIGVGVFTLIVAYVVASRLVADIYTLPVGLSLHISDVILAALAATWLVWRLTTPLRSPMGIVAILGAALIAVFLLAPYLNAESFSQFEADGAERGLVRASLYSGLFIASYHVARSRWAANRILGTIVVMTVVQSFLAVYEVVAKGPFAALGSMWTSVGFEVDPRAIRSAQIVLQQRLTGELRASATAAHPLVLVGLLGVGIGIAIAFYFYSESRRTRVLLLIAIIIQFLALGATNQRTSAVVIAALAVVILLTQIQKLPSTIPLAGAIGAGVLAMLVVSGGTARLLLNFVTGRRTDRNVDVRLSKYEFVPKLLDRRPALGAGYATHDPLMVTFDNGYLTALVEFGVVGFVILMAFLIVITGRAFASLGRTAATERPLLLSAVLAAAVFFASMATFDGMSFTQFFPTVLIVLAVGLARADKDLIARRERSASAAA